MAISSGQGKVNPGDEVELMSTIVLQGDVGVFEPLLSHFDPLIFRLLLGSVLPKYF